MDACLQKDSDSRVACETMTSTNFLANAGEVSCDKWNEIDTEEIARRVVKEIGYSKKEYLFCDKDFEYLSKLHHQSPDIAQGVNVGEGMDKEQGAGDQGMMFGYASNETEVYMPAPVYYSHVLLEQFSRLRKEGVLDYLRPDSKSQVSILYENGKPKEIVTVVLSHQTDDLPLEEIKAEIVEKCQEILSFTKLLTNKTEYHINPTGRFVIGGPHGDAGLTGRKIIVDTYGGVGSHGGGAFSGKDPSKVDRSAAYYARYVAKNIVGASLADKCEIQVSYAIGLSKPVSLNVDTYGTGKISNEKIEDLMHKIFDFRPKAIIENLGLTKPADWTYEQTANYGHFGREIFPWEKLDKVEVLKNG